MSYWRKLKQWKSTLLSLNGTILFWLADQNSFHSTEPIPSLWPQTQVSPGMRQFSITLHTLHKRQYTHNLWKLHCQICRRLLFAPSDINMHFCEVNRFTEWCTDNFLEQNTHTHTPTPTHTHTHSHTHKTLKKWYLIPNQFARTCLWLSVIKPLNKLGHTSTWVFTLTAISAGVYMLKLCAPEPRSVSIVYFRRQLTASGFGTNMLLFYRATIR